MRKDPRGGGGGQWNHFIKTTFRTACNTREKCEPCVEKAEIEKNFFVFSPCPTLQAKLMYMDVLIGSAN